MNKSPAKLKQALAPSSGRQPQKWLALAALGLASIGVLLRFDGSRDDLWVDELHTAWVVAGDWRVLPSRAAIGNQSPFYFYLTKLVTSTFGLSEPSLRFIPMASGATLLLTAWWYVLRQTKDRIAACTALAAVGLDRGCVFYSSEARPYGLMQLVLAWLFIGMASRRQGLPLTFARALLSSLAIYLQFTALLFIVPLYFAQAIRLCFTSQDLRSRATQLFIVEVLLVSVLVVPLASLALEIFGRAGAWATFVPRPTMMSVSRLFTWSPALIALTIYIFLWIRNFSLDHRSTVRWLAWASTSPVLLVITLDRLGIASLFLRRYLLGCVWPLQVISGLAIAELGQPKKTIFAILIVAAAAFESGQWAPTRWSQGRITASRNEAWSQAVERIRQVDPDGKLTLFIVSGLIESRRLPTDASPLLREYCELPVTTIYKAPQESERIIPLSSVIPSSHNSDHADQVIKTKGAIWLLRISPEKANSWRRYVDRVREELVRKKGDHWTLNMVEFPGLTLLELRTAPQATAR